MGSKGEVVVGEGGERTGDAEEKEPVSPTGQYFNSSSLSVSIVVVFESEVPIDDSRAMAVLENLFLPISPRFSSIMVRDRQGTPFWEKVKVNLEDHVFKPVFPSRLSAQSYDECTQNYLSKLSIHPLPQSQPLWEMHIIKYPTTTASGTLIFKLHHALGDGFSLMGALLSCLQRADDPSLPLTFPSPTTKPVDVGEGLGLLNGVTRTLSTLFNTAREFSWSLLKSNVIEDDVTPIRSGAPGIEFRPVTISCVTFSLQSTKDIKEKLKATVNDVIAGVIFYGTQLYMHMMGSNGKNWESTALVLLNTRAINSYVALKEMDKNCSKSRWGNQFGFLHVPFPKCDDVDKVYPLDFILKAKEIIKRKRSSLAVYLTGTLLEMLRRFKGSEAAAQYIHATLRNTTMSVSNLIGPLEQMHIANHPVKSFHFMVVGVPQSLTVTVVSYNGKLKVAMGSEKGFIDSQLLVACMEKSFSRMYEAAFASTAS